MIPPCHTPPPDKQDYLTQLGRSLVKRYGKKKYYKPKEVKKAKKDTDYSNYDFDCWGLSVFSSREDFTTYHQSTGEDCDYSAMRTTMLSDIAGTSFDSISFPDIDLDTSWLDFDNVLDSVGTFFSSIWESLPDIHFDFDND